MVKSYHVYVHVLCWAISSFTCWTGRLQVRYVCSLVYTSIQNICSRHKKNIYIYLICTILVYYGQEDSDVVLLDFNSMVVIIKKTFVLLYRTRQS